MNRRDWIKRLGLGATAGALGVLSRADALAAETKVQSTGSLPRLKITRVRAIKTAPQRTRLVVVKVETSEPGLHGLGCATFNQRPLAVVTAVEEYLDPFARGRDVDDIEDLWQNAYTSSYWRNGPVLNNALSGLDMALWDIKGKRANMPVHQLIGGKCRFAVDCYAHSSGRDHQELEDSVRKNIEQGFRHVRIQLGGYGSPQLSRNADFKDADFGLPKDATPAVTTSNCCTMCMNASSHGMRFDCSKNSSATVHSSSKIPCPPKPTITFARCARPRSCRSPWVSCSTARTSGCL